MVDEDTTQPGKPVDLGNGLVCASFGSDASWLSLGTPHPHHGFVELNALPSFDEAQRGDPAATRRYRASMLLARHAVVHVEVDGAPLGDALALDPSDPLRPRWTGSVGGVRIQVTAVADAGPTIRQAWNLEVMRGHPPQVLVRLRGGLDRPALAEITELDPPVPTGARTTMQLRGSRADLTAGELPATAAIEVAGADAAWEAVGDDAAALAVPWPAERAGIGFEIAASLCAVEGVPQAVRSEPGVARESPPTAGARSQGAAGRLVARALAYVRGCTALRTGPGERAILTDHRLLPLSWTRDAYYQALLLLVTDGPGDRARVADHLRWLWRRNERPDGRWVRSHHASGRRKDVAFQADQQLYPILELADYWRSTGTVPDGVDWTGAVAEAWDAALSEVDTDVGLVQTNENSADDPAAAPFIGASQIVLWYAARRLAELCAAGVVDLSEAELAALAADVRDAFERHLVAGGLWAYATDGMGSRIGYHDANDLPTALAPAWGFCGADDPGWRATMAFSFSPANPAYVGGRLAGLGSAHTPGAWTLGDVQAWLRATLLGDTAAAAAALGRLDAVAAADGMLPEAYVAADDGGIVRARHWFAWPGAAFAALSTLAAGGELLERLQTAAVPSPDRLRSRS